MKSKYITRGIVPALMAVFNMAACDDGQLDVAQCQEYEQEIADIDRTLEWFVEHSKEGGYVPARAVDRAWELWAEQSGVNLKLSMQCIARGYEPASLS